MKITVFVKGTKNPSPVYLRISAGRNGQGMAPTKIGVNPHKKHWSHDRSKALKNDNNNHELIDIVNESIKEIVGELHVHYAKQTRDNPKLKIDSDWVKEFIATRGLEENEEPLEYNGKPMDLMGYYDNFIEVNDEKRTKGTIRGHMSTIAYLKKYLAKKGKETVMLSEVTNKFIIELNRHGESTGLHLITLDNHLKNIRAVVTNAKVAYELPFDSHHSKLKRLRYLRPPIL